MRSSVRRRRLLRSVPTLLVSVCALLTLLYAFTHARLLRSSGLTASSAPGLAEWHGVLLPPAGAPYRFLLEGRGEAEVLIDGRLAADHKMVSGGPPVQLDRRQHDLLVRSTSQASQPPVIVLWARDGGHFRPVPQLLLVSERIPLREVD